MKTGSLRARVSLTILGVLAIVLAAVVTAVTLAYRAKLESDLRSRLSGAASAVEHARSPLALKVLAPGFALEGIAINVTSATLARPGERASRALVGMRPGATVRARGSLLVLDEVFGNGTRISFSASNASVDHAVTSLLLVELLVAGAALALATGDTKLRLNPSRTDTELGSLAVAFDQMLDALEAAIDEARASDAATRRFLADASHELRTPIAALQASVETLLREQPQRPERDRLEAAVARDSERLGRLVDDLLGLARLEAHAAHAATDLTSIARTLVDEARARAPRTTITLDAEDNMTISGDRDALERVLGNLVDNALAATAPAGRIDVQLRRRSGYVEALVMDDGPGVPERERERIFERFVRLDPDKPGHGLGLAIARRIAHQHHGELTCDPVPNGASFTLQLPAEPSTAS